MINRKGFEPHRNSMVCSRHFKNSCFVQRNHRRLLKKGSIPTQFIAKSTMNLINKNTIGSAIDNNDETEAPKKQGLRMQLTRSRDIINQEKLKVKRLREQNRRQNRKIVNLEELIKNLKDCLLTHDESALIHLEQTNIQATIVPELTSSLNTTADDINDAPMSDDASEYEVVIKSEVESDDEDHREPTSQLPQATKCSAPLLQPSTSTMNITNRIADPPISMKVESTSEDEISVSETQPESLRSLTQRNSSELGDQQDDPDILEWGTKLARMSPQQRLFAKNAINAVLNEAELGNLHEDSVCINKCREKH
ncbi:THAP domain-containing protein 2-like isoform X2 [Leptidea sinapis]|uniref:THAP domain-containing protein 2-like isoform X2 n=1 Tax=Leptidea sinapis TaxID=189913 RepID=UPI0021C40B70|nr:THAP domain-containing protein 2-like isoform X2 [Leptidea sinapis]